MEEKSPETGRGIWQILATEEMKTRWELVSEEDYSLIMAEYARLTLGELKSIENKINSIQGRVYSIQGWVLFFGILAILSLIGSICWGITLFANLGF